MPRRVLMDRLKKELNMSEAEIMEQLYKEIKWYKDRGLRA